MKTLRKKIFRALFFETLENVPLFLGGVLAVWLGSVKALWPQAVLAALAGCSLGALLIQWGEKYQSPGFVATASHFVVNFLAFLFCIVLANLYFYFFPPGWTDLLAGVLLGVVVTAVQGTAARNLTSRLIHGVSMGIASGLGLVVLRGLLTFADLTAVVVATLGLIVAVSLIITLIEYWPGFVQRARSTPESSEQS